MAIPQSATSQVKSSQDGAKALASEFKNLQSLQSLYLSNNNIRANGAKALTSELKNLQTLDY